jgi:hypothetical protein
MPARATPLDGGGAGPSRDRFTHLVRLTAGQGVCGALETVPCNALVSHHVCTTMGGARTHIPAFDPDSVTFLCVCLQARRSRRCA